MGRAHNRAVRAALFRRPTYSSVLEDERIIDLGLRPRPGDRVVCVTSGGCFSLKCLLADVAEVVSVDLSPFQTALVALKAAAAAALGPDDLWAFLGLAPTNGRRALYDAVRAAAPAAVAAFWDARLPLVERGVALAGSRDRALHRAGRLVAAVQGRASVAALLACATAAEQEACYRDRFQTRRWRWLLDAAFHPRLLDRLVRVEGANGDDVAGALRGEVEHVLRDVPAADNFYLHYVFTRTYPSREVCPAWLRASSHPVLRVRLPRLTCTTARLEAFLAAQPARSVDGFYLSNLLDWASPRDGDELFAGIARVARPGARLCGWSNILNWPLSPRDPRIRCDDALAAEIYARRRAPGYSACLVATVEE